mmetsp:Transcript_81094/g.229687  ORF Transcript_81094/g.229687 Transcript_81094/m.229687 type:complete len:785 (-) Transcript_81094:45-2399(-)
MVLSFLVAAMAGTPIMAYNWATSLYSYNRDAWMTDIQVAQEHSFQQDNLKIAMYSMGREEVRDFMQASINKINNTILVTTLILSLAGEMLFEGQIPSDCAPFVLNAYMLCLGSAIFHLVLSILFGVLASNEAYRHSTSLLTKTIRPRWKSHFKRMKHRKREELTRAFETKPLGEMLKPPLASRCHKILSKALEIGQSAVPAAEGEQSAAGDEEGPEAGTPWTGGGADQVRSESSDEDEGPEAVAEEKKKWHAEWEKSEREWSSLTACMLQCVGFGTKHLLEACSYLCVGTLYGRYHNAWAFWAVNVIFTVLNVLMMRIFLAHLQAEEHKGNMHPWVRLLVRNKTRSLIPLVPAIGPFLSALAAATPNEHMDKICVPLSYLSHLLENMFFTQVARGQTQDLPEDLKSGFHNCCEMAAFEDPSQPPGSPVSYARMLSVDSQDAESLPPPSQSRSPQGADRRPSLSERRPSVSPLQLERRPSNKDAERLPIQMLFHGMLVLRFLWISACCWAFLSICGAFGGMDWKNNDALFVLHQPRLKPYPLHKFDAPSPFFHPHALVCPKAGRVFLADRFRVFELNEVEGKLQHVDCDVNGTIEDIAATCNGNQCWPVILLSGPPTIVYDCHTHSAIPLLQMSARAERLATNASSRGDSLDTLIVSQGKEEMVQYGYSVKRKGFAPLWTVGQADHKILALDIIDSRLVTFQSHGIVATQDLLTGKRCGTWRLAPADNVIGGGCTHGQTIRILAVEGQEVQMLRAELPLESECSEPQAPHIFDRHPALGGRNLRG